MAEEKPVQHCWEFLSPFKEKSLINRATPEIIKSSFDAFLRRHLRQDNSFIFASQICHQPLNFRVSSPCGKLIFVDNLKFDNGIHEILPCFLKFSYTDLIVFFTLILGNLMRFPPFLKHLNPMAFIFLPPLSSKLPRKFAYIIIVDWTFFLFGRGLFPKIFGDRRVDLVAFFL